MKLFSKFTNTSNMIKTFRNWPIMFLCYFGLFKTRLFSIGPSLVASVRGDVRFKIRTDLPSMDDAGIIMDIWTSRDRHAISQNSLNGTNCVVDIGAHIGAFSVMAAKKGKNVRVYSYEPMPENFGLLVDNIELNGLKEQIRPFNVAVVGIKGNGLRKFHVSNAPETSSLFLSTGDNDIEVKCVTLADIFQESNIERCDFMKMDCEGAEFEILPNTPAEVFNRINKIHVEYHEFPGISYNRSDLVKVLTAAGFKVTIRPWHPHFGYLFGERKLV